MMNFNYSTEEERKELINTFKSYNIDKNKINILLSSPSHSGTSAFRLETPMLAIAEKYPNLFNFIYVEEGEFPINLLHKIDIWIQHRAGELHSAYLQMLKQFPIDVKKPIVIHDVDDDEVNLPPTHPMREMWYTSGKDKMAVYQLSNVDYITTTGRGLKREFNKYQADSKVKIFRNGFNFNLPQWNLDKIRKDDEITIGWAGLTSHMEDIKKMSVILKQIHDKYPKVRFKIAGITDKDEFYKTVIDENGKKQIVKDIVTDPKMTYRYKVTELFREFDSNRIEFLGILSLSEYGKFYSMWDINLAYIEHNSFNQKKSEIKIVEGAIYKNINIYSDFGGYSDYTYMLPENIKREHIKHCAMKTENPKEWVEAISYWIDNFNTDETKQLIENTYNYVKEKYSIYNQLDERIEFYKSIARK